MPTTKTKQPEIAIPLSDPGCLKQEKLKKAREATQKSYEAIKEVTSLVGEIKLELFKFMHSLVSTQNSLLESMEKQQVCLENVKNTNELAEETLSNVLLAIRQNEYLQAWYPAQKGFPEMKVVGPHPYVIERKKGEEEILVD